MFDNDDYDSTFDNHHFVSTEREEEKKEDVDLYAFLNVPRDASTEDIHKAYKQRCLTYHPDKQMHSDEMDRKEAERKFAELQRAHKILGDPSMRRIYDVMGIRGIDMEGWKLVEYSSTTENIRKEYEFLRRLRDNEILLQMTNPESNLIAKFSLIGCFQEEDRYGPEFIGMRIEQSVDFALVGSHKIGIRGTSHFNEHGIGNGTVQLCHKWAYSLGMQQETTFTTSPEMVLLSSRFTFVNTSAGSFLHRYSFVIEPMLRYSILNTALSPSISAKMIAPLMPGWQGVFALNFPDSASISLFNYTAHSRPKFFITLQLSPVGFTYVRLVYHSLHTDCHWSVQARLSMDGITPSLSYERQLSRHLRVALKVKLSYPSFLLQSSIRISTSLSSFEFCFILCDNQEDVVRAFVKGIVLPFIVINTARLVYRRMRRE